jgi:hydrogenase-4 component F
MILFWLIVLPLVAAVLSLVCRNMRFLTVAGFALHAGVLALSVGLAVAVCTRTPVVTLGTWFRADALSAFFALLIAFVGFASLVYSQGYLAGIGEDDLPARKRPFYYFFFHLFVAAMLLATLVDNLGHLWVAIEMTTLASTFLVGFYNNKTSVEAAWKYLIICSVGITIALLGTVLLYTNVVLHAGVRTLDWSVIAGVAGQLDPRLMGVAFLFILIGYGTKAGLVPMHTWLPDAHSQAMTPVSALLSGVLLKTSIYALIRFAIIAHKTLGTDFVFAALRGIGLVSIGVAVFFLLVQKDLKRLLAYSSIENVGIIVFGLGVGTPLGVLGALFHVMNHALTKALLFFSAGNIVQHYKTHNMNQMQGVIQAMPFTGTCMLIGLFAIVGMPPFAIFMSKLTILSAVLEKGSYIQAGLFLLFLAIAFAALLLHLGRVVFGHKPKDMARFRESLGTRCVFAGLVFYLVVMGGGLPAGRQACQWPLRVLLEKAADIIRGV